jgi:guanylate kinase
MTTRTPRGDEKDGADYFFVSQEKFDDARRKGLLLEWARLFDQNYGTPKTFVEENLAQGKKIILAIDVQGAQKVKGLLDKRWDLLSIFVLPPSVKVLRKRLEGRNTDAPDEIKRRIEKAQEEIKEAGSYDFAVVNQNLEQTVSEIERLIQKHENSKEEVKNAVRTPGKSR